MPLALRLFIFRRPSPSLLLPLPQIRPQRRRHSLRPRVSLGFLLGPFARCGRRVGGRFVIGMVHAAVVANP